MVYLDIFWEIIPNKFGIELKEIERWHLATTLEKYMKIILSENFVKIFIILVNIYKIFIILSHLNKKKIWK
jgi:hypothetical protein